MGLIEYLSTAALLALVCGLLIGIRQIRAYVAPARLERRPVDPEMAEIHDLHAGLAGPVGRLFWVFTAEFLFLLLKIPVSTAWAKTRYLVKSESFINRHLPILPDLFPFLGGIIVLLFCDTFIKYLQVRERYAGSEGSIEDETPSRKEASTLSFFWITAAVSGLLSLLQFQFGGRYRWYPPALNVLIVLWQVGMLSNTSLRMNRSHIILGRESSKVLTLWAVSILFSLPARFYFRSLWWFLEFGTLGLVFCLLWRGFSREMIDQLKDLTTRISLLVKERWLLLDFLGQTSLQPGLENFEKTFDKAGLLDRTLNYAVDQVHAGAGAAFMVCEDDKDYLQAVSISGMYPPSRLEKPTDLPADQKSLETLVRSERIPVGKGVIGEVAAEGRAIRVWKADEDRRISQVPVDSLRIHNVLAVPVFSQGKVVGVISLINKKDKGRVLPFSLRDEWFVRALSQQTSVALTSAGMHSLIADRVRMDVEMQIAKEVQSVLLPSDCPEIPGFKIWGSSTPAREVGGDYFDFIWIDPEHLLISVADVSGKGVPGAITMAMLRSNLHTNLERAPADVASPKELLKVLNVFMYNNTSLETFVSMLVGILDVPNRRIMIARAGHEPAIFMRGNATTELISPAGIALGVDDGKIFNDTIEEISLHIEPGDRIVFYTDGVTDAVNAEGEQFSIDRFVQLLGRHRSMDPKALIELINTEVSRFAGNVPVHDDQTLVVLISDAQSS